MPLLRLSNISLAFGHRALLDKADLEITRGERVCLVGRNGEGKSSLLRILNGEVIADDGELWVRPGVRIASLAQEVGMDSDDSVFDVVATWLYDGRTRRIGIQCRNFSPDDSRFLQSATVPGCGFSNHRHASRTRHPKNGRLA